MSTATPRLARRGRTRGRMARVSLVPLIDVLFILLIYFMVTSVYLDLDMIPMVGPGDAGGQAAEPGPVILLRLDAAGAVRLRGQVLDPDALAARLRGAAPGARVVILPSGRAPVQALAGLMDALAGAGVTDSRLLRIEARP